MTMKLLENSWKDMAVGNFKNKTMNEKTLWNVVVFDGAFDESTYVVKSTTEPTRDEIIKGFNLDPEYTNHVFVHPVTVQLELP